ncbi:acyltransferase [Sporolactobacillus sp. STSJ-5]|uniref:acyltransferase n=1 Tax=Sporolactobacillus sp. STSJ-5 TaxID=2965076 RepID=UPI0021043B09|nr:acyltransferase [Sporolactobacillus sp. STSJ-5]MCQ2009519.1 acyltransferase [Sporolactobacillus sp. STSJ-5]
MDVFGINKREISIDFLRILSCFLIILRHVNDNFELINNNRASGIILQSLSYPALPIFVMLTGYLMFNKEESYSIFFKKRFNRLLIPFVFWSFIYYSLASYIEKTNLSGISLHQFINVLSSAGASYHLWYVYFIIAVYLFTPILRKLFTNLNNKDLIYLLLLWITINSIIPMVGIKINGNMNFIFTGWWGYIILGFFIKRLEVNKKYLTATIIISSVIFSVCLIMTLLFEHDDYFFFNYSDAFSLPMIIVCFSSLYIFKCWNSKIGNKINTNYKIKIIALSNLTYAIYIMHAMVLGIFQKRVFGLNVDTFLSIPFIGAIFFALIVFIFCFAAAAIIRKIPVLKRTV